MLARYLLKALLLPPAINILLIVIGLLLVKRARRFGMVIAVTGVFSLWLLSTIYVASLLRISMQNHPALDTSTIPTNRPVAIVVAGAGHHDTAEEYGASTPTARALVRLHYAANLHRRTGLPVMLTGGPMNADQNIHSEVLAASFEKEFKIKARWLERKSATTWQNALFSAEILSPEGIEDIVLVTHAMHMQRSVHLFELAGFNVLAAPTQLGSRYDWRVWRYWMPTSGALNLSSEALYEYLGSLWYRLISPVDNDRESTLKNFQAR